MNILKSLIMRSTLVILLMGSALTQNVYPQSSIDTATSERISKMLQEGKALYSESSNVDSLVSFYARQQLGIPYVGGLLEVPPVETLVVTLDGSDCVLFVEFTTALTLTTLTGSTNFEVFEDNVKMLRYRNGEIDGYFSRLHYFGDWLQDNQRKGVLKVLFQDEAYPLLSPYGFMTSKREAYRQLATNDSLFHLMQLQEEKLNEDRLRYVPKSDIPSIEDQLKTGDIVAFVTNIAGLDVTHTAIIRRNGDRVSFWHASTTGAVIVEPKTLFGYANDRSGLLGIILARPNRAVN